MKKVHLLFILLIFLTGCQEKNFEPVKEDQDFAATLNVRDFSIHFLDQNGNRFARWELDKTYTGAKLLPDGDTLLLFGPELEAVDFYSLKTGKRQHSFKTGKGIVNGIYLEHNSDFAFADKERNEVRFFDQDGKEIKRVKTKPYPLEMEADGRHIYVASFKGKTLAFINADDYSIEKEIPIPASSTGMLLRHKDDELWIGGHGEGTKPQSSIAVYSLKTHELKEKIPAPLMPVDFHENQYGLYALSHGTNRLYRFDFNKKLSGQTEVGVNPFAIDFFAGKLVIAGFDSDEVYWVDPETLEIEGKTKVGKGPFIIFTREKVE
ncbi:YncE family protein [Siminovitchia sp. 179-K 8D1 HS]|uniref:YncE family protein n=1 Tax=Siminovitchia sp. 179-K 8D1 HS TaxID=3142385 RepID=UPI0039A38323